MNPSKLKVAFVNAYNVLDKKTLSGSPNLYYNFLAGYFGEVDCLHNLRPEKITLSYLAGNIFGQFTWLYIFQKTRNIFWRILGKKFMWEMSVPISKYYARMIEMRLKDKKYDLIITEKGSFCIAYLNTDIPIIYSTDATFAVMANYYPELTPAAPPFSREGNLVEKRALDKASLVVTSSKWAADSMVRDYRTPEDKIEIIACPAHLERSPAREVVMRKKDRGECRLLFVGIDWQRKGGGIAVEALDWLNDNGVPSKLIVCGCSVPEKYKHNKSVIAAGFFDKNTTQGNKDLEEMYLSSHFLILPTRAENFGQVFAEAAAYGLPVLASNTGGVPSAVDHKENGFLLDYAAKGKEYGRIIKEMWEDPDKYESMRLASRAAFENKFSMDVWRNSMRMVMDKLLDKIGQG